MLYELIVFGGIWFWILVGIAAIALLAEIVNEKFTAAFFTMFAFVAILVGFSKIEWHWFVDNKITLFYAIGFYLVAAVVTSIVKWYFYGRDARERYNEFRSKFLARRGLSDTSQIPEEHRIQWLSELRNFITHSPYSGGFSIYSDTVITTEHLIPQARHHKALITGWMAWWPFVAFWSLFDDFFRRLWEVIYRLCSKGYQQLSNMAFRGVEADFVGLNENAAKKIDRENN